MIRFACECGQQLSAREEYAGKRVRCSACGEVQTVPSAEPAAPAAAAGGMIRFDCSCGQTCQARPEYAGRNTKCPRCGAVLTIPSADEDEAPRPRRRAGAIQSEAPGPRGQVVVEYESDEEGEERPRRRRKRARKAFPWVWVGAGAAALLLVGGGVAVWLLVFRGGVSGDFDLVPRDAQVFATVRVADTLQSPLGKKVMDKLSGQLAELRQMESKTGLKLEDIERATFVGFDLQNQLGWGIIKTTKKYEKDKILGLVPGRAKENSHQGKTYYDLGPDGAIYFPSDTVIVFASKKAITVVLDMKKPKSGPLADTLELASQKKFQFVAGVNIQPAWTQQLRMLAGGAPGGVPGGARPGGGRPGQPPMGGGPLPGMDLSAFLPLLETKTAYSTFAIKDDIEWELGLTYADKDQAEKASQAITKGVEMAKGFLGMAQLAGGLGGAPINAQMLQQVNKSLDQLKPKQSGSTVTMSGKEDGATVLSTLDAALRAAPFGAGGRPGGFGAAPPGGGGLPNVGVGGAANRAKAMNNFKQIGLAFHNYHSVHNRFPPAVIRDQSGRALRSWRVELLPYLEQDNLYKQLRLTEPYNHPVNRRLLSRTPDVFQLPGVAAAPDATFIQVFTGPDTPFNDRMGATIAQFPDGLSNTILVAEANQPVNWAAPNDIVYNSQLSPRSLLGRHYGQDTIVLVGDGSVRPLRPTVSPNTLRLAINPRDGMPLGADW